MLCQRNCFVYGSLVFDNRTVEKTYGISPKIRKFGSPGDSIEKLGRSAEKVEN